MRTRALLGSLISAAAILLVGWELGTAAHLTPAGLSATGSVGAASSASTATATYLGPSTPTRYGDVQVQVSVSAGKITDVVATHLTDDGGRSVQISNRAAPVLRSEVLSAQSAQVQLVSGATYTSQAYLTSLQAALDQAGI